MPGHAHRPVNRAPGYGQALLRALLRDPRKQGTNLRLTITTVPPSVLIDVSFPALAQRVTVFGSTRNIVATSAGVSSGSASGVRADIWTASPPGPGIRSCVSCVPGSIRSLPWMSHMVYCYHIAITSGDKATTRSRSFLTHPRCPVDLSHVA